MSQDASAALRAIALRLKATGEKDLLLAMRGGLRAAAKPLIEDVKKAAIDQLPKGGGLNEQVANQTVRVSIRTGPRTAGVRLTTSAPDTEQTDSGYVRHPTFGRRGKGQWKTQSIPAAEGWWSKTLAASAETVTPELVAVMELIALDINGL